MVIPVTGIGNLSAGGVQGSIVGPACSGTAVFARGFLMVIVNRLPENRQSVYRAYPLPDARM
jgi:hypothetical protein